MAMHYEIPNTAVQHLGVGTWVEIIEAYDLREETDTIRVMAMRIGSKIIEFSDKAKHLTKPLRPHEGQIVAIEKQPERTLFQIHLS